MNYSLELAMPPGASLEARRIDVRDVLNEPFRVNVIGVSTDADLPLETLIGQPASVQVTTEDGARRVYRGVIARMQQLRGEATGLSTYAVDLRPPLWLLGQVRNYRCFQAMSEPEIAIAILREWNIPFRLRLDLAAHPRREMRVQYGESDLAFAQRMLEAAGVSYWFEDDGVATVVLHDAPTTAAPTMMLAAGDGGTSAVATRYARGLQVRRSLRPGRYTMFDYDLRRKASEQPSASVDAADAAPRERSLERFHYAQGAFLAEAAGASGMPVADQRIGVRALDDVGAGLAQRRLEAKRSDARQYRFKTNAVELVMGSTVTLGGQVASGVSRGEPLLVVGVSLTAERTGSLEVTVDARATTVPFRPALSTPKPRADSVESAIVVVPEGEEIDTDELGRVRVHFPWDRGPAIGGAWVPVSQPWAGSGFGEVNLPRGGQEVLVQFRGGDPDQPVITGRTYTALQPVPFKLPANKTESGWKSNSTGNTGGYNELMLEDRAGAELVRMHAQRDIVTDVLRNEERAVDNDRAAKIGRDDRRTVKKNQLLDVGANVTKTVGGTSDSMVGNDASRATLRGYRSSVAAATSERTGGNTSSFVDGDDTTSVNGPHEVTAHGKATFKVGASTIEMDTSQIVIKSGGGATLTITDSDITIDCDILEVNADGSLEVAGNGSTYIQGYELILLGATGNVSVGSSLIKFHGGGRPFSKLGEPSPDKIMNGSATVQLP